MVEFYIIPAHWAVSSVCQPLLQTCLVEYVPTPHLIDLLSLLHPMQADRALLFFAQQLTLQQLLDMPLEPTRHFHSWYGRTIHLVGLHDPEPRGRRAHLSLPLDHKFPDPVEEFDSKIG